MSRPDDGVAAIPVPYVPQPVLYAVACGSPAAGYIGELVRLAQHDGWQVCVVATPDGRKFIDVAALAELTGHPVRSEYKNPGDLDVLPAADAIVVAPATVNTVNKWACGIADTLALGMLIEGYGLGLPIAAMPYTNTAMAAHPAFRQSLRRLRTWGVRVLFGDDVMPLPPPGAAAAAVGRAGAFPWRRVLTAIGPPQALEPLSARGRLGFVTRSSRTPPATRRVVPAPPMAPRPAPAILRTT
jgi:hypothetical protein